MPADNMIEALGSQLTSDAARVSADRETSRIPSPATAESKARGHAALKRAPSRSADSKLKPATWDPERCINASRSSS